MPQDRITFEDKGHASQVGKATQVRSDVGEPEGAQGAQSVGQEADAGQGGEGVSSRRLKLPAITPGPWKAIGDDDRHEADTIPVKGADGHEICEAYGWPTGERPDMTVAEAEANAKAIAAVPKLLEALVLLLDEVEPLATTGTDARAQAVAAGVAALRLAGARITS